MKHLILFSALLMLFSPTLLRSQETQTPKGEIRGKVIDSKTKKPIDYAALTLIKDEFVIATAVSDENGSYLFVNLDSGEYQVRCTSFGYSQTTMKVINVKANRISFANLSIRAINTVILSEVVIINKRPLIDHEGKGGSTKTSKNIMALPLRNPNMVANTVSGVDSRSGSTLNFRGARTDGTAYYIDGVRVAGNGNTQVSAPVVVPNQETYLPIQENKFKSVKQEPLSTFSVDVDKASYAIVRRYLTDHLLPPADAVRIEEMINYFPYYNSGQDSSEHPIVLKSEVCESPWDKKRKLVHITLKAPEVKMSETPPANIVFLIDVSGSMESLDKLYLLKSCLQLMVNQLRPQDKISIVVYAGSEGLVLEAKSGKHKEDILSAIENLSAGGSTAGGAGIELAYKIAARHFIKEGNNRVILATDGDFNVGITNINELQKLIEQKRNTGVFLSVLGFGTGNLKDATMETLADKGNGNYHYIDNLLEGKKVLVKEASSTLLTVAKDVKIQIEFNPAYVKSYRLIGYENRMLNKEDFNDDKKDAGEIGAGHTVTAIYELITDEEDVEPAKIDDLKYQQTVAVSSSASREMMTIKVRYKKPDGNKSIRFDQPVFDSETKFQAASSEIRFAVCVAMFGMKLRQSEYAGKFTYQEILETGQKARGEDPNGYRGEFLRLVETAQLLAAK